MTQGKIERYHGLMENILLVGANCSPDDLMAQIEAIVQNCNHPRHHEVLNSATPDDTHFGRAVQIQEQRKRIEERTMKQRNQNNRKAIAIRQTVS